MTHRHRSRLCANFARAVSV